MRLVLLTASAAVALIGAAAAQTTPATSPSPVAPSAVSSPAPSKSTTKIATSSTSKMTRSANAKSPYAGLYRRAEIKLKAENLYSGPIDGRRTAAYVTALEKFQTAHNIKASGRLTPETRKALGV